MKIVQVTDFSFYLLPLYTVCHQSLIIYNLNWRAWGLSLKVSMLTKTHVLWRKQSFWKGCKGEIEEWIVWKTMSTHLCISHDFGIIVGTWWRVIERFWKNILVSRPFLFWIVEGKWAEETLYGRRSMATPEELISQEDRIDIINIEIILSLISL